MNANAKTLERLQTALSMELTAVHQYQLHAHSKFCDSLSHR